MYTLWGMPEGRWGSLSAFIIKHSVFMLPVHRLSYRVLCKWIGMRVSTACREKLYAVLCYTVNYCYAITRNKFLSQLHILYNNL